MEETKNIQNEDVAEVVASEEVMEVALSDDNQATEIEAEDSLSGLTPAQKRRREIFDHITTGILILLLSSPILILAYIFLWFILR